MHKAILPALGLALTPFIAMAQPQAPAAPTPPAQSAPAQSTPRGNDCRFVVAAEPGAVPYKLCMTRAEWAAKTAADSKDANRLVCHYEEAMGTRFKSYKLCMPASAWDARRMADREAIERIQRSVCIYGAGC